jgi:hypothetical protein
MPQVELTKAWTSVEAVLPRGWDMTGVVKGPREVDPVIHGESWLAWARGPDGERVEGSGDYPEQAVKLLAAELRRIRKGEELTSTAPARLTGRCSTSAT